jgi:hypothetical protein
MNLIYSGLVLGKLLLRLAFDQPEYTECPTRKFLANIYRVRYFLHIIALRGPLLVMWAAVGPTGSLDSFLRAQHGVPCPRRFVE